MTAAADFRRVVLLASKLPEGKVIFTEQNGKRPAKPYLTVKLTSTDPLPVHRGLLDAELENRFFERHLSAHRTGLLQLQLYGGDALELADQLAMGLATEAVGALLDQLNLSLLDEVKISDVPNLVDDKTYEPRAILEVNVAFTSHLTEEIAIIETVVGEMSINPAGPQDPQPFTATVVVTDGP